MKLPLNNNRADKGFTLLEMAVAVAILGIVVASLVGLFVQSLFASKYSKEITAATLLAQEKIEEIKSLSFEELQKDEGLAEETVELSGIEFILCKNIEKVNDVLMKISVEVRTKNNNGLRIVTYRGKF
ncbi:type II secretion system protein I [Caldanaerovirga acetigignens]|uniref:Type II secretion system protein I n=1 Tax=Caldanaerovirga acetigignens TaxID=447595 RepID=A0A1M7JFZ1_9FIRM|nr:type II secretion system protein [Caldanaerovirga acetigignens]SHM51979.1 type II secretion system protein I [Caldanaerovirga acetigignens]